MSDNLDTTAIVLWMAVSGRLTQEQKDAMPIQPFRYVPPSNERFSGEQYAFDLHLIISNDVVQEKFLQTITEIKKNLSIKVSADIPLEIPSSVLMKSYRSMIDIWRRISVLCDEVNLSIYVEEG